MYQALDESMRQNPGLTVASVMVKPRDPATAEWARRLDLRETPAWPPRKKLFSAKPRGYVLWPPHDPAAAKGCALCGRHFASLDVEHDHSCDHPGKGMFCCRDCVRGLTCRSCNLRIGAFERGLRSDPDIRDYLARHHGREPEPDLFSI